MIEDQIISFKTAVLVKKRGFDLGRLAEYYYCVQQGKKFHTQTNLYTREYQQDRIAFAFTQSLLQRWLREVYDIHIYIEPFNDKGKTIYQSVVSSDLYEIEDEDFLEENLFNTYEEALEDALIEGLNLIK